MLRRAALSAACVLALGSIGDVFVLATVLAVGAAEAAPAMAAGLFGAIAVVRIGSSSMSALAGAQAVLGPAGWVGPPSQAAAAWASAAGLTVASPRGWAAVPFGATAALAVAGPAPRTWTDAGVRAAAVILGVGAAAIAGRWLPRPAVWMGVAVATAGLAATVAR